MYSAYAALTAVLASPFTLAVMATFAFAAIRPLLLFDDRLKQRKRARLE